MQCAVHRSAFSPKVKERNVPDGGAVWKAIASVKDELFLGGGISGDFNLMPYAFLLSILLIFLSPRYIPFPIIPKNKFYFKGKKELKTEVTWTSKLAGGKKLAADIIEQGGGDFPHEEH